MGKISKALNLLNYFSEIMPEIGLAEFSRLTGQDKATVHRHLAELESNGFLDQNPYTRKYRLGAAVLRLSAVRERTFPARRIVSQWVDELSLQSDELVHASLIQGYGQGYGMSSLYFRDTGSGGTRVYFSEADILPLHATASGICALAFGPPNLLQHTASKTLDRFTQHTVTDHNELNAMVEKTRRQGYSFTNQTYEAEICSIAAPFFEDRAIAYGTITIAVPASRMNDDSRMRFVTLLWNAATAISAELGGAIPEDLKQVWNEAAHGRGQMERQS